MGSTINGNAGAAASGAIVTATPVDARGAVTGTPQQAVVGATGAYSFSALTAGTYKLAIAPAQPNAAGASQPNNPTPVLKQPVITVDGSTTYAV